VSRLLPTLAVRATLAPAAVLSATAALAVTAVLAAAVVLSGLLTGTSPSSEDVPAGAAAPAQWSPPAALGACPANATVRVVFPSDSPSHATGAGAIIWSASSDCSGGEGARVAAIGAAELPGAAALPRTAAGRPIVPRGALLASGAPDGQIVIAGSSPGGPRAGLLIQGASGGPFSVLQPIAGSAAPMALTTAYLGDVALASPPAGGDGSDGLRVDVERFYSHEFVRSVSASAAGDGPVQALTLAMDYRSDAVAVWAQGGAIYAHDLPAKGAAHPIQRLASVGSHVTIAAVLSDDYRAIVAWSEQRGSETSVYIDRSGTGVRFRAPQLLERFGDPDGLPSPAGSPSLVRLSSESVMLAWAGSAAGRWVVRTAPVDLHGVLAVSTIAAPGADALLADLASGPDNDALVLWTEPLPSAAGRPDMSRQAIFAARGTDAYPGRTIFGEPEEVAPPAPVSDPSVALDPDNDDAVAAWQGEAATIKYSIRRSAPAP
jgi:hypothetical protein